MVVAAVVGAVAGTKLFIGTTQTVPSPDLFTEIKQCANIGEIGTNFNKIAVESVGDGYTRQIKGTQLSPTFNLVLNRLADDPGQLALVAAAADRTSLYNFKIQDNDTARNNTPTQIFFKGRVFGSPITYGGVNALKQISSTIEVEPDSIIIQAAT
jgi:hypothetical protein